jgi:small neutral amino acid transporter SnatA (MarC family)
MDDQQHALAALLRTIPIASAAEPPGDAESPSGWLWAAALLLALNPARAVFGIPRGGSQQAAAATPGAVTRGGRSPQAAAATPGAVTRGGRSLQEAVALAAAGGAIGGVAVCVAALAGEPILDTLDVSEPSFRTAAGVIAVVAGAIDLFRRPPSSEPALAGRRAALVPVAVPLVARPALLVLALGAGADEGVLVTAGAMAIGVAALTALTARSAPEGPSGRVLRWAGRVLAAGLVACGVLLTIDGVLDV